MTETLQTLAGRTAVVLDGSEPVLDIATLVEDLIGLAWQNDADLVVVSAARLPGGFFALRTGVLGTVAQKFSNYHLHMAVIGDIARHVEASSAFRDYVREANAGGTVWFLPDLETLETRLPH